VSGGPAVVGFAPCYACRRTFAFDVDRVTSVLVDPVSGLAPDLGGDRARARREPLCPRCCRALNPRRRAAGLEPLDETDTLDGLR
jgi:hypothetical protein